MEMIQTQLGYPKVHTDIVFVEIPPTPLDLRPATEHISKPSTVEDDAYSEIETQLIRGRKNCPE